MVQGWHGGVYSTSCRPLIDHKFGDYSSMQDAANKQCPKTIKTITDFSISTTSPHLVETQATLVSFSRLKLVRTRPHGMYKANLRMWPTAPPSEPAGQGQCVFVIGACCRQDQAAAEIDSELLQDCAERRASISALGVPGAETVVDYFYSLAQTCFS